MKDDLLSSNKVLTNSDAARLEFVPEEIAVCYLALLLRFCRRWLLETRRDSLGGYGRFVWSLNLGVPSPCIEDNEENRAFRRVGKAAWMLSTLPEEEMTVHRAGVELAQIADPAYWDSDWDDPRELACDFDIIPEIAAGAVGYALSDHRREGLHVIVDVGASTVDACSFILQAPEGSDRYSLLMADVRQLGVTRLFKDRVVALRRVHDKLAADLINKHDPLTPLDESIEPYLVSREQLITAFSEEKDRLKGDLDTMLRYIIWQTKKHRAPDSPLWRSGRLPLLLIGGGSKSLFFRSAVEELDGWLKSNAKNDGTALLSPPVPKSLISSLDDSADYCFLTVAWGLSHRAMDVGEIIPADTIPDVEPPLPLDVKSRFIGKELV